MYDIIKSHFRSYRREKEKHRNSSKNNGWKISEYGESLVYLKTQCLKLSNLVQPQKILTKQWIIEMSRLNNKNFEWRKRKRFLHVHTILFKTINRFLRRNFAGQQPMSYSHRTDKPKSPAGSTICSKTDWKKKSKRNKATPIQTKTKNPLWGMFLVLKLKDLVT